MFSTLSMDYKAHEPPSSKPDSPYDNSRSDDQSGGHGGTRRPGNLWTAEAREDMFRRREAGETWETICLDYPKRSRHAMQQQYSMMKKQKAIANGTWTTNRRGRKRRNPGPERWPASAQRKTRWDIDPENDLTDSEDFDDLDSENLEESEGTGTPGQYYEENPNGRPSGLIRSATEPTKPSKPRIISFPVPTAVGVPAPPPPPPATMLPVTSNGWKAVNSPANGSYDQEQGSSAISRKRRRLSQEPAPPPITTSTTTSHPVNIVPSQIPNYVPPSIMLDREDLLELLRKGEQRAKQSNDALETERTTQRQTFDGAIARANRRACDAQEKVSFMNYEHGDAMKSARAEFAETLKSKSKEHSELLAKVTRDFQEQERVQTNNINSLARHNDELQKEIEVLRSNRPGREAELEQENAKLKAQLRASTDNLKQGTAKVTTELLSIYGASDTQTPAKSASLSAPALAHGLGPSDFEKTIKPLAKLVEDGLLNEFGLLFSKIAKLNDTVDDLSQKQIIKDMRDIVEQKDAAERNIKEINKYLQELTISHNNNASNTSNSVASVLDNGDVNTAVNGTDAPKAHAEGSTDAMEVTRHTHNSPDALPPPPVTKEARTTSPPGLGVADPPSPVKVETNGTSSTSNYPFLAPPPPRATAAAQDGPPGGSQT